MIATHNIKVNGRWYHAGEELPGEETAPKKAEKPVEVPEVPKEEEPVKEEPVKEEAVKETKARTSSGSRRKKISE